jgi:hypothetical protein
MKTVMTGVSRNGGGLPRHINIETVAEDNEPRISDEDLAQHLGYARVENFRALVRQNEKMLRKINILRDSRIIHDGAGRPGRQFHLTETQAVFLIGKAGTPDADEIFARIAAAFVEYRRASFRTDLYGAAIRDLLLPAPRDWEVEFKEPFWTELHRVGGWKRPAGNNHSLCSHFINEYVYGYLLGSLGLAALRDANPKVDGGARANRHHQMLKDKHLSRLRQHINTMTVLLTNSVSMAHFASQFARSFPDANLQLGFLFHEAN